MPRSQKPESCAGCPAREKGLGFVPGVGPPEAEVAWVGQGPGEQEYEASIPFHPVAPAGSVFTKWLESSGLNRDEVWVGNTVCCWLPQGYRGGRPYGSVDPTREMQEFCWREYVGLALERLGRLRLVVPLGAPARHFLLGKDYGERYCGAPTFGELPEFPSGGV